MAKLQIPRKIPTPESIRIGRETELARKLMANESVRAAIDDIGDELASVQLFERTRHLAASLRINASISPYLWKLLSVVKKVLSIEERVDLYVESSHEMNAFCWRLPDDTICVVVSSQIVEILNEREMLFLLGHELGHAILRHHDIPATGIIQAARESGCITPAVALQLMAWSRCAEISADRFGLVSCQSSDAATQVFIKLASGLPQKYLGEPEGFDGQFDEWREHSEAGDGAQNTHPLLPLRVRCSHSFAASEYLTELYPNASGEAKFSKTQADQHAYDELRRMDPDPELMEECSFAEQERMFLAQAGLILIQSDHEVADAETAGLVSISTAEDVMAAMVVMELSSEGTMASVHQLASQLVDQADLDRRLNIITKLVVLAAIDFEISAAERQWLQRVSDLLRVPHLLTQNLIQHLIDGGDLDY
jgi:Zn-dependent protease with chaperone function/uncharacterized tellurite resistance protein B-like protein